MWRNSLANQIARSNRNPGERCTIRRRCAAGPAERDFQSLLRQTTAYVWALSFGYVITVNRPHNWKSPNISIEISPLPMQ